MALSRRTPCIGICSTTYGDLVCRGCKRFAHEIVQWNSYDPEQQQQVWTRLRQLRDEVLQQHLLISDGRLVRHMQQRAKLEQRHGADLLYGLLQYMSVQSLALSEAGLAAVADATHDARTLLQLIDTEIYQRSTAHYERNFKVLA